MRLGFIILAHKDLHRVTELAMFLSKSDCPVGLHIDQNADPAAYTKLLKDLSAFDNVHFAKREKCGWGQFSIVKATLNAAEALFEHHDDLDRVFLASGSCLPARPLKQLKAFLARHPNVDFIESFSPSDAKWVKDGLDRERFTLFFPLSWR
ncbi:MAG: glycosyl transferase, partial [Rhodobacteraceae bacterium]